MCTGEVEVESNINQSAVNKYPTTRLRMWCESIARMGAASGRRRSLVGRLGRRESKMGGVNFGLNYYIFIWIL